MFIILLASVLILILIAGSITLYLEAEGYNNGICKRCDGELKHFTNDPFGRRGYRCEKCGYITWIHYTDVDKKKGE